MAPVVELQARYGRYRPDGVRETVSSAISLRPEQTAFLIIDAYGVSRPEANPVDKESFWAPAFDDEKVRAVFERIVPAREAARALGIPIVFAPNSAPRVALDRYEFWRQRTRNVNLTWRDIFLTPLTDPKEYEAGDSLEIRMDPEVGPRAGDYLHRKITYSAFFETFMEQLLRNLDIKTVIACGFSVSECLLGSVIDAMYRNFDVVLLRDAGVGQELPEDAAAGERFTDYMFDWMETFAARTVTTDAFVTACEAARGASNAS
jgi:ureidoacrylate peracid hydrolase